MFCTIISCSNDTGKIVSNFKLYYSDTPDIDQFIIGIKIPAPTFEGGIPNKFVITTVILNGERVEADYFVIDKTTGEITINNTQETAAGEYKLTIACIVDEHWISFRDIVKITFSYSKPLEDDLISLTMSKYLL